MTIMKALMAFTGLAALGLARAQTRAAEVPSATLSEADAAAVFKMQGACSAGASAASRRVEGEARRGGSPIHGRIGAASRAGQGVPPPSA
ncbi:MAG: hypothetical protein ACYC5T_09065 [Thiobacillus sp.]